MTLNLQHRFDAAAVWAGLDPEDQAAIGAAALDLVAFCHLHDQAHDGAEPLDALRKVAETEAGFVDALQLAFVDAVPRAAMDTPSGQPRVPLSLGMVCALCGCSEANACDEGCGWAADSLCTACADPAEPGEPR